MRGAKDLAASERGVFALLVVVAATLLVVLGSLDGASWVTLVKWVAVAIILAKTWRDS